MRLSSILTIVVCLYVNSQAMTDTELTNIKDGFESRAQQMLVDMYFSPRPAPPFATTTESVYNKLNSSLARFELNYDITTANNLLIAACDELTGNADTAMYYFGEAGFHWHGANFIRIYELYGPNGQKRPNQISPAACQKIWNCMWNWAKKKSLMSDTEIDNSKTWYIWASENHDMQRDGTSWGVAKILKDAPPYNTDHYDDGSTAAAQYNAWTGYFKEYLRERAKRGLFVEIDSAGYASHTMKNIYNFYDFSDDPVMKYRAKGVLDLWWTDWALEQIGGVRGGSKARCYQGSPCQIGYYNSGASGCWFYLNIGNPNQKDIYTMTVATSAYRMPLVTMDIALGRGNACYEYLSRRPGLSVLPKPAGLADDYYAIDPFEPEIVKYTYVTPDFVMGTSHLPKRNELDWSNISDQNRWHGVIFAGNPDARIFPQCEGLGGGGSKSTTYNEQWSIQNKGTLITQKLSTSWLAGNLRVWFASMLTITEESGWVFAQAPNAYAAVKVVYGGYTWQTANWLKCSEVYTPVIIEAARKSDFADFQAFKTAVLNNPISYTNKVLTYQGLLNSGNFTFYADSWQSPLLNGQPINYKPQFTFQSPYLNEDWASGVVTISKDARALTLDFNKVCPVSDLNNDCRVDVSDFAIMASEWLMSEDIFFNN